MNKYKIVILGGYGTYGRLIAEQLAHLNVELIIAGRNEVKGKAFANSIGAKFSLCDVKNRVSLQTTISGANLVINAAGPFQAKDYTIPQVCIDQRCHYIDLGDGREYVTEITQLDKLAKAQNVFVCVGASTAPAITAAAVAELNATFQPIHSIKITLSAGNKNQAGVSTIASILTYVGSPVSVWQNGRWQEMTGWSQGEFVHFPQPIGRRRVQVCNVPDLALFPNRFRANNVIFKAGLELTPFNYAIALLAQLRQLYPSLHLPGLAKPLVHLSRLFKLFGTFHGSCAIWLKGETGPEKSLAVVAPKNGPHIPAAPAVLLGQKLLAEGIPTAGAFPCVGFLTMADFSEYFAPLGISVVYGLDGVWLT
jgi:short-subunit dehydrogenase involved in D-alanine esterification of teichoic acids